MPKKLIISLSIAFVVIATGVFGIILLRSRVLSDTGTAALPPPGTSETTAPTRNTSPAIPSNQEIVVQEGICGDAICEEGEQWCKVDCGSSLERFQGSVLTAEMSPTSFLLKWHTEEVSTGTIAYGTSEQYELGTRNSDTLSKDHEVKLTGLSPGGGYYVLLKSVSEDGSVTEYGPLFYETPGQ